VPDSWDGLADTRVIGDFVLLVEGYIEINPDERFLVFEIQIHIKDIDKPPGRRCLQLPRATSVVSRVVVEIKPWQ
jgi:hypothetical protein